VPTPPIPVTEGPLAGAVEAILAGGFDRSSTPPPGALVALARGGRIAYAVGGLAHTGTGVPMRYRTATDAGSVTKIIATTTALMALVGAGAVNLDAPVRRYLPETAGGPAASATVRDLLEHQAGLWEWWPLYLSGARDADALRLAATLPARYPARSGRHYSDLGFILLGAVVARAAGADLATAVRGLVLERFRLASTRYTAPVAGVPVAASSDGDAIEREMVRRGVPYPVTGDIRDFSGWRDHTLVGEVNDGNAFHAFGGVSGHAGLFTTADDLLRLATGLARSLHGDGPLRRETVTAFLAPGRDPVQALGLRVWPRAGGTAFGHTGFPGVAFALLPARDAAIVMVTNRLHAGGTPRATETMWLRVLDAADEQLALE
jgi:CubicO group peptidase (beta-lactamase class C family)